MKQKEKKARNRRTNEQIDKEVISELEKLVAEYGFGNVNLSALMKAANIEANVFYRRYGSMDNLYDRQGGSTTTIKRRKRREKTGTLFP